MDAARWSQVRALFERALDTAPHEREAVLRSAVKDDAELFAEVMSLLEADARGHTPVEAVGAAVLELLEPADLLDEMPSAAPYRLIRPLGRGGMGVVYLAERADGSFQRRAALKVMHGGADSGELLRRFQAERRILASLEHPNIARLYDAGVASDGRPYLVMEHVEGAPIDRYADGALLDVRTRIDLFRKVCEAVAYAHRALVIHRDLKPSNILVGPRGEVKLLDFGIAKLLDADGGADGPETGTGRRLLTPEYAAPEQIRGDPLGTSADVYSLGVVLYELLCGRRPFEDWSRAVADAVDGADRARPVSPSRVVGRPVEAAAPDEAASVPGPEEVARRRGCTPERLHRVLRGDLDHIVLKALARDPDERYESSSALADDLERYLLGLPVTARPPSVGYRMRKFVRRHRAGVAAAVAAVASLGVGAGIAANQARVAAEERDLALAATDFLIGLFEASDPYAEERLDTLRVAALLDLGTARARDELAGEPALRARMLGVLGRAHWSLGSLPEARSLLEEALAATRGLHDDDGLEVAAARHELARVLAEQAEYDEAERLYRAALEVRRRRGGAAERAETLGWLGEMLRVRSRYEEAEPLLVEALELRREHADLSGEAEPLAASLGMLASLRQDRGDLAAAESLRREALDVRRLAFGPEHPLTADALANLATVLFQRGRLDEAVSAQEEALAIYRATLPDLHPKLANALNVMGVILADVNELERSRSALEDALDMRRRIHGNEHPGVAVVLNNLAYTLRMQGDLARAEAVYRQSLALNRRIHGDDHVEVAKLLNNLASLLGAHGRYAEAEPLSREAVAVMQRQLGAEPPTAIMQGNWANHLRRLGRLDEAAEVYRGAVETLEARLPAGHPSLARARLGLGGTLRELGRFERAEPHLLAAAEQLERDAEPARELVRLYEAWGRPSEALPWREGR